MKRKITLSLALTLSVLALLLASSDSTAQPKPGIRRVADTGIVTLGPNQVLRVTVTAAVDGADFLTVRFRRMQYAPGACNGGVCQLGSVTDLILDPVTLMPGEAVSIDIPNTAFGVRGLIVGLGNIGVTAMIINTSTGEVTSHIIMTYRESDFH